MKFWVNLFVTLKIPDAEAATAKNTLRRHLGYEGKLKDLKKEAVWSALVEADDAKAAEKMGREFAERELVNENKESYRVEVSEKELEFGESALPRVFVRLKIEDGVAISVMHTLQNRLGFGERVVEVKRGSLWIFDMEKKFVEKGLVEKAALDLLVNQNKDEYFVL